MSLVRIAIALVAVVAFMMIGASAIDETFTDSGQVNEITGETLNTGGVGTIETLEQSNVDGAFYDERPRITNGSGVLMNQPGDYTWFEGNGTFRVESAALANENGVSVDYSYTVLNQNQEAVANMYGNFIDAIIPIVVFFLTVALVVGAMLRLGAT